jgi:hypothetical protein
VGQSASMERQIPLNDPTAWVLQPVLPSIRRLPLNGRDAAAKLAGALSAICVLVGQTGVRAAGSSAGHGTRAGQGTRRYTAALPGTETEGAWPETAQGAGSGAGCADLRKGPPRRRPAPHMARHQREEREEGLNLPPHQREDARRGVGGVG